jgi:WD40 repeat protein
VPIVLASSHIAMAARGPAGELLIALFVNCVLANGQSAVPIPQLVVPHQHSGTINAIATSPDGKWFASAGEDRTIRIWSWPEGLLLRTIVAANAVDSLAVHPNGKLIVSGDQKGNLQFWNASSGEAGGATATISDFVYNIAFSPDGHLLAAESLETLHVFETVSRNELWKSDPGGLQDGIKGQRLAFSKDSKFVVTASVGGNSMVWDAGSGAQARDLSEEGKTWISLAVSPSGKYLAAGSVEGPIRIWSTVDWSVQEAGLECSEWSGALFFGSDDNTLYVACGVAPSDPGSDGRLQTWNWRQKALVSEFRFVPDLGFPSYFDGIALTPDNHMVAGLGTNFRIWDLSTRSLIKETKSHGGGAISAAFARISATQAGDESRDQLVAAGRLRRFWLVGKELRSRVLPSCASDDEDAAQLTRYVQHGDWVVVLTSGLTANLFCARVWNLKTDTEVASTTGPGSYVYELAASSDGTRAAWVDNKGTVSVWNIKANQIEASIRTSELTLSLEFSSNGQTLAAAAGDGTIRLFSAPGWNEHVLGSHMNALHAAESVIFLDHDSRIISGHRGGALRVWTTASTSPVEIISGGNGLINRLALSHDGRTLVSASEDHEVRIWHVESTGMLVPEGVLTREEAAISSLAFNSEDEMLAIGTEDSTIAIWKLPAKSPVVSLYLDPAPGSKRWFAWTPTGYFDGGDDGWEEALWRFRNNTFSWTPLAAYFKDFFYKGLFAEALDGRPIPVAPKLAPTVQPVVVLSVSKSWTPKQSSAEIQIQVTSPRADSEVRDLRLYRNGVLVHKWAGKLVMNAHGATVFKAKVGLVAGENVLVPGENVLTAYAFNSSNVASSTAELILKADRSIERAPSMHVLSVGIDHYTAPGMDLKYAVADAAVLVQSIEEQQRKNWRFLPVAPKSLYNADATKAHILAGLRALATESQPQDSVVIFFASHGFALQDAKNGNRFYLLPADVSMVGPKSLSSGSKTWTTSAISDLELEEALRPLDAAHILLIIDSCRSGQVLNSSEEPRRGPLNASGLAQLAYEKGISILTASQSYQDAIEVQQFGHGLLTHVLVEEGLQQFLADREPKDGEISWTEWIHYALDRVPELQSIGIGSRGVITPAGRSVGQRPGFFVRSEEENDKIRWNTMDRMSFPVSLESLPQGVPPPGCTQPEGCLRRTGVGIGFLYRSSVVQPQSGEQSSAHSGQTRASAYAGVRYHHQPRSNGGAGAVAEGSALDVPRLSR